jgi:hypothetical protein
VALLAGFSLPAWSDTTWTFTCSTDCNNNFGSYGNTRTATADGVTVTARAFSNTGGSSNTILQTAYLSYWSGNGLGVTNRDACTSGGSGCGDYMEGTSPEHAIDNNQRYDAVLFSFSDLANNAVDINLTQVALSWFQNDADMSVFAYTADTAPNLADGSTTYSGTSGLLNKGWELVGNYADVQQRPNDTAVLGTDKVSSYWLVMAYNSAFSAFGCNLPSGGGSGNSPGCTNGSTSHYDYFKTSLLTGDKYNGNPEPGSMALLAATLGSLIWVRRQRKTRS